jgi:Ca2+-binding RTX toxin-like protein
VAGAGATPLKEDATMPNKTFGDDTLYGTEASDALFGLFGNDVLKGFGGADLLDGGWGNDTAVYTDSTTGVSVNLETGLGHGGTAAGDTLVGIENLYGSSHNDFLTGNAAANIFYGLSGIDILNGGDGSDALDGGGGNDTLKGGGGADVLIGGAGIDTVDYSQSPSSNNIMGVHVNLNSNSTMYNDAALDTFSGIENITGSSFQDHLIGDSGANLLMGILGNDELLGAGGDDRLEGGAGRDALDGGSGLDIMIGGTGDDFYYVDAAGDVVTESGGEGIDTVLTYVSYALTPGADVERLIAEHHSLAATHLTGNSSGNEIVGNSADNVIDGGGGVDEMAGRYGNDLYFVDNPNDAVSESGGQGLDEVRISVSWILTAGADAEILRTTDDDGTAAIDLTGNATGNVLRGNNGSNVLDGGAGNDELTGRGGADSFLFDSPLDAASNVDTITDFNVPEDTILLDQTIFSSSLGLGNISAGELVIGSAAQDANDRIIYDSTTGALFYDNDGVGGSAAVQFAELTSGLALTNLDFLVV